jgi:hypothetical protein
VCLFDENKKVHRFYIHKLVAETFLGERPEGAQISYDRAFYAHRINDLEDAPQDASVLSELAGQNQWWCGPLPEPEIWNGEKQ